MRDVFIGFMFLWLLASPLLGQGVVPVGEELLIDGAGDLAGGPSVATDSSGNFFVAWATWDSELQGQLFDAGGDPQGPVFQINSYTTGGQGGPEVLAKGDGEFVVVWSTTVPNGPGVDWSIDGQRFTADGTALGTQFEVTANSLYLSGPTSAATGDGEFVVVWRSYSFRDGYTLRGQRLAADGLPLSGEFQIDTHPTDRQYDPQVRSDADGDFVVVWESYGSFGDDVSENSIQARRFASSGAPLGDQFQVNTQTTFNFQEEPAVGVAEDGSFVVAWKSGVSYTIEGQRFASDGTFLGGQFLIDESLGGLPNGRDPEIAMGPGDAFLVTWRDPESLGDDTDDDSIQARFFPAGGGPGEPLFQLNTYTTGEQNQIAMASDRDGGYLVVWRDSRFMQPGGFAKVRGQFATVELLFTDGFESGDAVAWSNTAP